MAPLRRREASREADVPAPPAPPPPRRPIAEPSPAARAALLQSASGYHVTFPETKPPSPLDDVVAYTSKQLRR